MVVDDTAHVGAGAKHFQVNRIFARRIAAALELVAFEVHDHEVFRLRIITVAMGAALGGLAGGLLVTFLPVNPGDGNKFLLIAFFTVAIGGLGSLRGALAGNHVQAWELFDLMIDTDPEINSCIQELVEGVLRKKLVERVQSESDKRVAYAVMTKKGMDLLTKVAPHHVASVRGKMIEPHGIRRPCASKAIACPASGVT